MPFSFGSCSCVGTNSTPNPPLDPCPNNCDDCLIVSSPLIQWADSVGPCGKTGTLNVEALNDYSVCTGSVIYQVLDFDRDGFTSASINPNGTVTFVTSSNAVPKQYYQILYKVSCPTEGLSAYGAVTIGINDLCEYQNCPSGCDKCTGECEDANVDIQIGMTGKFA